MDINSIVELIHSPTNMRANLTALLQRIFSYIRVFLVIRVGYPVNTDVLQYHRWIQYCGCNTLPNKYESKSDSFSYVRIMSWSTAGYPVYQNIGQFH